MNCICTELWEKVVKAKRTGENIDVDSWIDIQQVDLDAYQCRVCGQILNLEATDAE